MNPQKQVAKNIKFRGYREGWTNQQFAARQVCKLVEELGELADCLGLSEHHAHWRGMLYTASEYARLAFDSTSIWSDATISSEAKSEIADCQVVLFNLAEVLGIDSAQAAVDKSAVDVKRGVR